MINEVYKNRSVSACIKAGISLFTENLRNIWRKSWIILLIIALLWGALFGWWIINGIEIQQNPTDIVNMLVSNTLSLASMIATSWLIAQLVSMLTTNSVKIVFKRVLLVNFIIWGTSILVSLFAITLQATLFNAQTPAKVGEPILLHAYPLIISSIHIVYCLFLLPCIYAAMHYFVTPETTFKKGFLSGYSTGIKYYGYIFSASILSGLLSGLAILVISSPLWVLLIANIFAQIGVINGDANTLPAYFPALVYGCSAIVSLVCIMVYCAVFLINFYVYGAITTRQTVKKAKKSYM